MTEAEQNLLRETALAALMLAKVVNRGTEDGSTMTICGGVVTRITGALNDLAKIETDKAQEVISQ